MLFDEIFLIVYILTMAVLLFFASHGIIMLFYHRKYIENIPTSNDDFNYDKKVTIQLPLFNEQYVAERLIDSVCKIDYPKDLLEIQVLDDSTDSTVELVGKIVEEKRSEGFDIQQIRRTDRSGFKAGALKEGLKIAKGEMIAIFDADFVPNPDFLKNTLKYFTDSKIGMVQTRWEHLNEDYSILTITKKGYGKRSPIEDYRLTGRACKGVINMKLSEKTGNVISSTCVTENDTIIVTTHKGIVIRMSLKNIRIIGRATQGVKLINLNDSDYVSDLVRVPVEEDEISFEDEQKKLL